MRFVDSDPMTFPPPESIDAAGSRLGVALMSFVRQPALSEYGVSTVGSSANGAPSQLDSAAISYTLWRNPDDHDDPANLAELTDLQRQQLDAAPVKPLPEWMLELRRLAHYPSLWEAVMTTRMLGVSWQTPASVLVAHANHIVTNTFREQRVRGGFPGELDSRVEQRHIRPETVLVDGAEVAGLSIDTDPHVFAVAVDLGDRTLSAVVARDHLPHLSLAFETRQPSVDPQ